MGQSAVAIPEKIFFKIGEVCEIVDVQAHVLRYWETEFPMLSPQKNRSGQRSYRRRDVEIALRIKELLYDELYTIAGAKKKLQTELRETSKLKIVPNDGELEGEFHEESPGELFEASAELELSVDEEAAGESSESLIESRPDQSTDERRQAIAELTTHLFELRDMLGKKPE
jgi:DNA-binding transcriptional MerR regulator